MIHRLQFKGLIFLPDSFLFSIGGYYLNILNQDCMDEIK
jgi:hypothetical protein